MFYFLDRGGVGNQLSNNAGYDGQYVYTATAGYRITLSGQVAQNTNNSAAAQTALPLPAFGPSAALAANPTGVNLIAQLPNNQNGAVEEYNIQVQQQLDRGTPVTVAYVGTKGDHLSTWFNLNNTILNSANATLYPNRSSIQEGCNCGESHYNGLQLSLNRNVSKNLTATVAYTWSHTLDNSNGIKDGAVTSTGAYSTATNFNFGTINGTRTGTQRQVELAFHVNF